VLQHARPVPATWELTVRALHCVLAEDVTADIDLPPFDKALVDGYAVRSIDLEGMDRWLRLGEVITAGRRRRVAWDVAKRLSSRRRSDSVRLRRGRDARTDRTKE